MSFIETVSNIILIAEEESIKDENLKTKHGVGEVFTFGSPETNAYMSEARSLENSLKTYLNTLSIETLGKLETIMYFGRDSEDIHNNDIPEFHQEIHPEGINRTDVVRNISEKRPALETYFNDAKRKADDLSINLENII